MDNTEDLPDPIETARALLAWYRTMGVEDAVCEAPIDWLQRGEVRPGADFSLPETPGAPAVPPGVPARTPPSAAVSVPAQRSPTAPPPAVVTPRPVASTPPDAAVMAARTAATGAASLDDLRAALEAFSGCALKATAKNLCFYRGAARARMMIIGEAPGRDEDLSGTPFVGPAGKLLDKMLTAAGFDPAAVHITNTVYWRPPGNRTPSPQETQACRPFLDRQIELVEPQIVVLLGGAAANTVLGAPGGIMKLRGSWREIEIGKRSFKALASLHPAFLLRSPAYKKLAWRDMLTLAEALGVPVSAARAVG